MAKRQWKEGLTTEQLKKRDEQKGTTYRDPGSRVSYIQRGVIKMYVPREGKNRLRIIQPFEVIELGFFGMEMHFHRSVGDEGEPLFGDYLCNSRMKNILRDCYEDIQIPNTCFVCKQQTSELWDENPDLAKTYYPDRRMWLFVIDLLSDDKNEVLLWSCPWTLQEEIVSRSSAEETGAYMDVSHPVTGVPVSFERVGKGKLTKYVNVQVFNNPLPLSDDVIDQMLEFRDLIVIPSAELVESAFLNASAGSVGNGRHVDREEKVDEEASGEVAEEGPPECFKKEYDAWKECETCDYAEPCSAPPEKPSKPERPSKRTPKPKEKAGVKKEETGSESKKASIRDKIKAAQEKQNKEE